MSESTEATATNVVPLKTRPQTARESVLEMLEDMLQRAKEGEFDGMALAYFKKNGAIGTRWSDSECAGALYGAVALLHHRLGVSTDAG